LTVTPVICSGDFFTAALALAKVFFHALRVVAGPTSFKAFFNAPWFGM
jgi:hypothetical protein